MNTRSIAAGSSMSFHHVVVAFDGSPQSETRSRSPSGCETPPTEC